MKTNNLIAINTIITEYQNVIATIAQTNQGVFDAMQKIDIEGTMGLYLFIS